MEELAARLEKVEAAIADFNRRSAHRESVIDRLHEENQVLRSGVHRALLDPVIADLVRVHDGLTAQAARLAEDPAGAGGAGMFASFADDVAMILDRCGLDVYGAEAGAAFDPAVHTAASTIPAADATQHNTVAATIASGLVDREAGRVRRPAKVRVYQSRPQDNGQGPADDESGT